MQKVLVTVFALFFGLITLYWLASPDNSPQPPKPSEPTPAVAELETMPTDQHPQNPVQLRGHLIPLNASGEPIPSPPMRALFNQLALDMGNQPVDRWKHTALLAFQDQLSQAGLERLQKTFNYYVEYQLALQLFAMEGDASLSAALDAIAQLRGDYLSPADATGLFSDWSQLEQFSNQAVHTISQVEQPGEALNQLKSELYGLPESVRQHGKNLLQQSNALLTMSNDTEALRQAMERIAAEQLVQPNFVFSEPDAAFMESYENYQQAKEKQAPADEATLQALRRQYFEGADQLRAKTLDRMEQL